MVKDKPIEPIKLPAETKRRLEEMDRELKAAESALAVMKDLGLDTKTLDDKLEWSKKVREQLLEKFS